MKNIDSLKVVKFTCRYGQGRGSLTKTCILGTSVQNMVKLIEKVNEMKIENMEILSDHALSGDKRLLIMSELDEALKSFIEVPKSDKPKD